jgi:hypothetical protein
MSQSDKTRQQLLDELQGLTSRTMEAEEKSWFRKKRQAFK